MAALEPSQPDAGFDEVDSFPSVSGSARRAPHPFDPYSRGRRAQTVR